MATITLPHRFDPWPHQEDVFHAYDALGIRHFFAWWHRRGGKDKTFLNLMIREMMERVGNYCHVFPQRNRARRIVWQGLDDDGLRYTDHFPPELIYRKSEVEMTISLVHPDDPTREGSIWWCLGSDKDVHLLVGANPIAVIWSEFGEINPRMRELVMPILRRNGGWEAVVGTSRGRNHAYRLYHQVLRHPEWHVQYLTIDDTVDHTGQPLFTAAQVASEMANGMLEETAQQEYYLAWDSPMPGAYYAEELRRLDRDGRIRAVPYDPTLPTYTAWDLGRNDANAIWFFQPAGREVRFIDYLEGHSLALAPPDMPEPGDDPRANWITRVREKPYVYDWARLTPPLSRAPHEVHYGPHDLEVSEYSSNKTRYSIALRHGLRFTVIPRGPLEDGIATARQLLVRSVFDAERCAAGLEALRGYRREFDAARQGFLPHPVHDHCSNGADAFRYAALGLMPPRAPSPPQPPPGSYAATVAEYERSLKTGRRMRSYAIGGPRRG